MKKIKSFTDLYVWQKAHQLVLEIYKLTDSFPKKEQFVLTSQILRCAISISSNIAEGFSRQTQKEKKQFYFIAKGSITELQNQLLISRDVGYISNKDFKKVANLTLEVIKLLNNFIKGISKLA